MLSFLLLFLLSLSSCTAAELVSWAGHSARVQHRDAGTEQQKLHAGKKKKEVVPSITY